MATSALSPKARLFVSIDDGAVDIATIARTAIPFLSPPYRRIGALQISRSGPFAWRARDSLVSQLRELAIASSARGRESIVEA
jgi:hypothetical protein